MDATDPDDTAADTRSAAGTDAAAPRPDAGEVSDAARSDDFPSKLAPLFVRQRWRYKIIPGGRGGARSWSAVRAVLRMARTERLRVVFLREIQRSLEDSVYQLTLDQIERMGLGDFYSATKGRITGANGSFFSFRGLSNITAATLKSLEGYDIAVVEEAQTVTAKSWKLLIPTIRNEHSEIWVLLNPELDTDPTYTLFIEHTPPRSVVVWMNWRDNPWFPKVLADERAHALRTMSEDDYNNVWEGRARSAVLGAIYAGELAQAQKDGRLCNVPYDPRLSLHTVLDLGWNDKMFVALVQRRLSEIRIPEAWEVDHRTLDYVSGRLRERPRNWGRMFLPHDGTHGDFKTGKSTRMLMEEKGWRVGAEGIVPNVPIETGIKRARELMGQCYIDKDHAKPLIEALKRYKRVELPKAENFGRPQHDKSSHGADCFRYIALAAERMENYADEEVLFARLAAQSVSYPTDSATGM